MLNTREKNEIMKESTFFDGTEPVYKVINHAFSNIKTKGFYESIFTSEYTALDDEDQNLVIGVILGDYGITIKDLLDECLKEKIEFNT